MDQDKVRKAWETITCNLESNETEETYKTQELLKDKRQEVKLPIFTLPQLETKDSEVTFSDYLST